MFSYIRDPGTNSVVEITSKIGRNIINRYINQLGGECHYDEVGLYENLRCQLDIKPRLNIIRVSRRASNKYYKPQLGSSSEVSSQEISKRELSPTQIGKIRSRYQSQFPLVTRLIAEYNSIDQGVEGACSFVAFLNLTNLTNNFNHLKTGKKIMNGWQREWNKFDITAAADIADVLDKMIDYKIFKADPTKYLAYIPIRSRGNSENSYNTEFWSDEKTLLSYFRTTNTTLTPKIIQNSIMVFQNGYLIENLLSQGIYVEINALEHSRTCVAFNDTHLLFADNWGDGYEEIASSGMDDSFSAGFSVVDKWAVYTNMRDIVYYR